MTCSVLLLTDGFFHPPLFGRLSLRSILGQLPGFSFQHRRTLEALPRLDLGKFSTLVIYLHHQRISSAALDALDRFVSAGGGLLGIHSATACFKQTRRYSEILGGRFTGHGPVERIRVQPALSGDPLFSGIGGFTVRDELYLHEIHAGVRVHFETRKAGETLPVVWTYVYGKGRVCYACPGHTSETMQNPLYQKVLQRGLEWVSGEL